MNYTVTVEIVIDADNEQEAERGVDAAVQNLTGSDILACTIKDVKE